MYKIMIAGTGSGTGKTTITLGILKALHDRGYEVTPFKCGPDYIDPMYHGKVLGVPSRNLDSIFCEKTVVRKLFNVNAGEFSVIEGVMGFYDGVNGKGSSHEISEITETSVILVLDSKGMGDSIGAVMKGFLGYRKNAIAGFIFNRLPKGMENRARELCEQLGTGYFGSLPLMQGYRFASRHLGLITADEVSDFKEKVEIWGRTCEESLLIDEIIRTAECQEKPSGSFGSDEETALTIMSDARPRLRIGLACDKAFCFIYQDNLDFLERAGCEIVRFSPIADSHVPAEIDGLILPGGYPELYAAELSANQCMLESIAEAVKKLPTIAECGGFMYLHEWLIDEKNDRYPMVGIIRGSVHKESHLVRFGYVRMTSDEDTIFGNAGQSLCAHEFHYFDSTDNGEVFQTEKLSRPYRYRQGHADERFYGGFPHLYLYGNPQAGEAFLKKCEAVKQHKNS